MTTAERMVGEIIMITTPALHTPKKWPGFMERARVAAYSPVFELRKFDGTPIETHAPGDAKNPSLSIYRRKLHNLLYTYARELGIPVTFESRVTKFFETVDVGGVILENGSKLTADVVVAADGVGSKSRAVIDGNKDAPISSGFIMYRISFPVAPALQNPVIAKEFAGHQDRGFMYIGPGAHMPISKSGDDICWLLTCKASLLPFFVALMLKALRMKTAQPRRAGLNRQPPKKPSKSLKAGSHSSPRSSKRRPTTRCSTGS
jgi:2-polyprenyl-6-methoxyphenol hydroxylase-like FAD-dependent oxidoreductase